MKSGISLNIGSSNGLSLVRCQAITQTIRCWLIVTNWTLSNNIEIWIKTPNFSLKENAFAKLMCEMMAFFVEALVCSFVLKRHRNLINNSGGRKWKHIWSHGPGTESAQNKLLKLLFCNQQINSLTYWIVLKIIKDEFTFCIVSWI